MAQVHVFQRKSMVLCPPGTKIVDRFGGVLQGNNNINEMFDTFKVR